MKITSNPLSYMLFCALLCVLSMNYVYANEPIVIGVPTSLSFLEGKESLPAVELAVEEINAKGGVILGDSKRLFKVESLDLRDAAPGVPVPEALLGLEKMILEKKPAAILVGPFRSEALLASMDIISKYKVPMLGTIAMTPGSEAKIRKEPDKYKYIFRVSLNVIYWIKLWEGTLELLKKEFDFNRVYLMNQDISWARDTANALKNGYFAKTGWEVLGHDQYPTGSSDFSSGLMKAKFKKAQVLFSAFDMPEAGIMVNQWRSIKVPALIAGYIGPMEGEIAWKTYNGKIGGLMNAIFELGNMPAQKYPPSIKFYEAYKKKYGKGIQSGHGPAPSYESVYVLKEAIERANSLDPDNLVKAIEQTDRIGAIGRIRFDEAHQVVYGTDPTESAISCFFQWTDEGKRKIIYPKNLADGEVVLPSWMEKKK